MAFAYAFAAPSPGGAPFVVASDYAIEPYLPWFLAGWPVERLDRPARDADIVLRGSDGPVEVALATGEPAYRAIGETDGVNRLADLLAHLAAAQAPGLVELHASSVLLGDRLAVLVGPSLSGKSTLALQLAARGHRLFGDDRLLVGPLDGAAAPPFGIALGLTPRVRRPPHPRAGENFARFVARHVVEGGGNVGFMQLPVGAMLAPLGAQAPLGALVLPERRDAGGIQLRPAGSAAASRAMLEQVHAPRLAASAFVAAVQALVGRLPAWHMQYDDSEQAALALRDAIGG